MKRKVNQLGNQSYSVVLPMDWIKKNRLQGKTEVEIEDFGKELKIRAEDKHRDATFTINVDKNHTEESLFSSIITYYHQGVKKLTVSFKSKPTLLKPTYKQLEHLWGIDCTIEDEKILITSTPKNKRTDEIFKKSFFMLLDIASQTNQKEIHHANLRLFFLNEYSLRILNTEISLSTEELIKTSKRIHAIVKTGKCLERIKQHRIKLDLSPFIRRLYDIIFKNSKDETLFIDIQKVIKNKDKVLKEDIHFFVDLCKELI